MSDLLVHFNIPFWISISLLIVSSVLNIIFMNLLSKSKSRFDNTLRLISDIQKEKYTVIKSIYHHLAEIRHCVYHIENSDLDYQNKMKNELKTLREISRMNVLIIGELLRDKIQIFSDNLQTIQAKELNLAKYYALEKPVTKEIENIEMSIPAMQVLKQYNITKE